MEVLRRRPPPPPHQNGHHIFCYLHVTINRHFSSFIFFGQFFFRNIFIEIGKLENEKIFCMTPDDIAGDMWASKSGVCRNDMEYIPCSLYNYFAKPCRCGCLVLFSFFFIRSLLLVTLYRYRKRISFFFCAGKYCFPCIYDVHVLYINISHVIYTYIIMLTPSS